MTFLFAPAPLLAERASLAENQNARLRSMAEYESNVLPLYLHLEYISWEAVLAQHIERWQQAFINKARHFVRDNKGCWAGKQFCAKEPEFGIFYRKPVLPIPLAAPAQHKMNRTLVFFRQVLIDMSAREVAESWDKRKTIAEQLKHASLSLTNTTTWRNSAEWEPDWSLIALLEPKRLPPAMQLPDPEQAGEILAKIEHFGRCWDAFHKAEHGNADALPPTVPVSAVDTPPSKAVLRPAPILSPADRILGVGFTLEEADRLAHAVGLTNEEGHYCLGPRKLGALVGFTLALQQAGKLTGAIPDLTAVLAPRWGVQVATRKTTTTVAQHYFNLTNKALI